MVEKEFSSGNGSELALTSSQTIRSANGETFVIVDDKTPHLKLPLPSPYNNLEDDVGRLRASFTGIDTNAAGVAAELQAVNTELAAKADAATVNAALAKKADASAVAPTKHGHPVADITGVLPVAKGGTGNATSNAATATKLQTTRTFTVTGDLTSPATSFDGTGNVTLAASLSERAQVLNNINGTVRLNLANGLYIAATIAGTTTLSVPTAPAGGCATVLLELTNGGNHSVTWGMAPRWSNGVAPILTAGGVDLVALTHRGGRWIGALIASNVR